MRYFARRLFIFSRARASALLFLPFSPSSAHRITHSFRRFFKEKRKSVLASCCLLSCFLKNFCLLLLLSASNTAARGARERDKTKANKQKKERKGKEVVGSGRRSRFVVVFVGRPGRFITPLVKSFVSTVPFAPAFAWPLRPSGFRHKKHIRLLSLSLSLSLSFFLSFFLSFSLLSLSRRRRRVEIANRKKSVKKERENTIFHSEFPILLSHEKMTH